MAAGDLVTLEQAREFLQLQDDATELDPVTEDTISRASAAIRWSAFGREFTPSTAAARDFLWDGYCLDLDLAPYDLRTVTSIVVDPDDGSPTTLTAAQYRLRPIPATHGVYTKVKLSATLSVPTPGPAFDDRVVRITGDWGFASVPGDVQHACLMYIAAVVRGEVQAFGSALQPNSFGEGVNDSEAFPPGVRGLLFPYMRMSF